MIFRQTPGNKFTIPLLLALLEKQNLDRQIMPVVSASLPATEEGIQTSEFAILIYSFMTPHLPAVWHEIETIRSRYGSRVFMLAGGPHASGAPEETMKMGFDAVVSGPGESVLADLILKICDNPVSVHGRIIRTDPIQNLDEYLPYSRTIPFMPPLEIMRGCFYRCGFCQTGYTHKPVYRNLDSVKQYVSELVRRNFIFRNGFICPSGLEYGSSKPGDPDLGRLESLLAAAKSAGIRHLEYGIFPSEIHPRTLTREALKLIRKYCRNRKLTLGAQSGSNEILKKLKRGHTTEDIESAADLAREHGFRMILDFILGFPGETEEDRLETLKWIRCLNTKYKARTQMHYFIPLSGTPYANENPVLPGPKSCELLDLYYKNGLSTNWWRKGIEISWNLVRAREELAGSMKREMYHGEKG